METNDDVGRQVYQDLKQLARDTIDRIQELISLDRLDEAIGALGTIEYVLRCAKEWK